MQTKRRPGGDDLLARERRAAALDHVAAAVDLVGAVDVDRQLVDLVGVEHPDAQRPQPLGAMRCELDTAPAMRSFIVASASMNLLTVEPVPTPTISPGTTYFERGLADQGLEFVLGHARQSALGVRLRECRELSDVSPVPYALARPFLFGLDPEPPTS